MKEKEKENAARYNQKKTHLQSVKQKNISVLLYVWNLLFLSTTGSSVISSSYYSYRSVTARPHHERTHHTHFPDSYELLRIT